MKANKEIIKEIENLLNEYTSLVENLNKDGTLEHNTARTYLLHSTNFVRWCKGDFKPGARKKTLI